MVVVLALAAAVVGLYPQAASWFHAFDERAAIQGSSATRLPAVTGADAQLARARAYNTRLADGAEVSGRIPAGTTTQDYKDQLTDGTGIMARLKVPSAGVDLPVYHGTSDATLTRGLGHLEGSALPVGGTGTRSVITGHRGLAGATMFTHLDRVRPGDTFTLTSFGSVLVYRVTDIQVVDPDETEKLDPVAGEDLVTLVTCTPLGINSQRILVTGTRVTPVPAGAVVAAGTASSPGTPWWAVAIGAVVVACGIYLWLAGRPRRTPGSR